MEKWRPLSVLNSEDDYEAFREASMCCSSVFLKRDFDVCRVCSGAQHTMVERRLKCTSKSCTQIGTCRIIWKVLSCSAYNIWRVIVNEHGHIRGVVPCASAHPARVSPAMKLFLAEHDEIGIPLRLIWVNLKTQTTLAVTSRGWPGCQQIRDALKRIRRDQGTKNSIKAVKDLVQARCYRVGMPSEKSFLFGSKLDREGFAHVGSGSDSNSFIVGITSLAMIDSCVRFSSAGTYCQFHAGATFKLSDIGYPVISCGFTDKARSYQLEAFFVVSRRTAYEYTECFRSFVALVRDIRGTTLRADGVMGDAEDAQYLAIESVPAFAEATKLMCFFTSYNVRKRTQHLPIQARMKVMKSILDMHFCKSLEEFEEVCDQELLKWRETTYLGAFADYFEEQWLQGRYWQWQAYHTHRGYASTNNPCENLNGSLKLFLQRRRHHMRRLLIKVCEFIETTAPLNPVGQDYIPKPTTEVVRAAAGMIEASWIVFDATSDVDCVRVLEIDVESARDNSGDEDEYRSIFGEHLSLDAEPIDSGARHQDWLSQSHSVSRVLTSASENEESSSDEDSDSLDTDETLINTDEIDDEEDEASRNKQKDLYDLATKWSLRRSHRLGMPHLGWMVDLKNQTCGCRYFDKFLMCTHVVAALRKFNLTSSTRDPLEKLKTRIQAKAQTKRGSSKQSKTKSKKKSSSQKNPVHKRKK